MHTPLWRRIALFSVACLVLPVAPAHAQLDKVFSDIFNEILDVRLLRSGSPGQHGTHFLESADRANKELVPALNGLIAGNVSSFPLSSTAGGVLFDFSTGQPVRIAESMGPILSETAKPLGKGKFLLEANYTYLDLAQFRGLPTDQMRFTFTHKDVDTNGVLGTSPNEDDVIDLFMDLHAQAGIGAVVATMGVTNDLDVSLALPIVTVHLTGTARAVIGSYTFGRLGHANHFFSGDTLHPVLTTDVPYNQSATGLGDIAVRLKYSLARGGDMDFATLLDVRLPTGKKENFLGSGKSTIRLWAIMSKRIGDFTPHLNLGYAHKAASYQSDAVEFRAGFDSKLSRAITWAFDLLGQIDVNADEAIKLAPGSVTLYDLVPGGQAQNVVQLSNVPDRKNDNAYSASTGFRFAPSDNVMLFANVLIPMNDGGLRAHVAPTVGLSVQF
jgi:hypothetical protein